MAELHYAVAYDGSRLSERACDFAGILLANKEVSKLSVLHVSPPAGKREKVPAHLTADHLKEKVSFGKLTEDYKLELQWLDQARADSNESTGEALCKLVHEHDIDVVVLGSFGRKEKPADLPVEEHQSYHKHDHHTHFGTTSLAPGSSHALPVKLFSPWPFTGNHR